MPKMTANEFRMKQQEKNRHMLDRLKNLTIERLDLDEAVALAAYGRSVEAEYGHVSAEAPDWLTTNLKELRKEIRNRLQDTLERRLAEAKAKLAGLSTTEEKREALKREIETLTSKVGA